MNWTFSKFAFSLPSPANTELQQRVRKPFLVLLKWCWVFCRELVARKDSPKWSVVPDHLYVCQWLIPDACWSTWQCGITTIDTSPELTFRWACPAPLTWCWQEEISERTKPRKWGWLTNLWTPSVRCILTCLFSNGAVSTAEVFFCFCFLLSAVESPIVNN